MVNDDNLKLTDDGFYPTKNFEENILNDKSEVFENSRNKEFNTNFKILMSETQKVWVIKGTKPPSKVISQIESLSCESKVLKHVTNPFSKIDSKRIYHYEKE